MHARYEATGELELVAVVKLAEAVLLFQARMLGGLLRPGRRAV
jgi:hypothetical protein